MDRWKMALDGGGMTVKVARKCVKDRKEGVENSRAYVYD